MISALLTDAELAARLAHETGVQLVELRERMLSQDASPWSMMDAGDALAHRFIVDTLHRVRPDDAVLSEE
ncbi:MAG: 3'(2'),5'-bisphosphate nucleotidase CysQ, partial [Acidimicrobiia bacterium]|nr:3'(2'),5'-bisphosphate nucleotidase CysQ [Acidimicrobiia bacterium]